MMRSKLLSAVAALALISTNPALAQVGNNVRGAAKGGAGGGSGDVVGPAGATSGNIPTFSSGTGKAIGDSTYKPSDFALAGIVADASASLAVHAADVSACKMYRVTAGSVVFTFDATSTPLSTNGCIEIETGANTAQVTANAADTITFAGATTGTGGNVTLPTYGLYRITIKSGNLDIAGTAAQGNATKTARATGTFTSGNAVKTDASGNFIDAGVTPGGGGGSAILPNYIANNWYLAQPYVGLSTPAALGNTTTVFMPFSVNKNLTLSAIGTKLITASSGQTCRLYVYAGDPATNKPTGSALADSGNISTTTAGNISGAISLALTGNALYFEAAQCSDATAALEGFGITNDSTNGYLLGGANQSDIGANGGQIGTTYTATSTYGTAPSNPTVSLSGSNGSTLKNFIAMFKVGSVP